MASEWQITRACTPYQVFNKIQRLRVKFGKPVGILVFGGDTEQNHAVGTALVKNNLKSFMYPFCHNDNEIAMRAWLTRIRGETAVGVDPEEDPVVVMSGADSANREKIREMADALYLNTKRTLVGVWVRPKSHALTDNYERDLTVAIFEVYPPAPENFDYLITVTQE